MIVRWGNLEAALCSSASLFANCLYLLRECSKASSQICEQLAKKLRSRPNCASTQTRRRFTACLEVPGFSNTPIDPHLRFVGTSLGLRALRTKWGSIEEGPRKQWGQCVIRPWFSTVRHTILRSSSQQNMKFREESAVRPTFLRSPSHVFGEPVHFSKVGCYLMYIWVSIAADLWYSCLLVNKLRG